MLAAERGLSRNSIAAYESDLRQTSELLGGALALADEDALGTLAGEWRDFAASTVARKCAALRHYYGFLLDEGLRADDPSSALPRPALQRPRSRLHLRCCRRPRHCCCCCRRCRRADARTLRRRDVTPLLQLR